MLLLGKYRFSFDTWKSTEVEDELLEESPDIEDADVETSRWEAIDGSPCDGISILFVDGVRRTEHLVYIEDEYGTLLRGAFVSIGAGALFMKHNAVNIAQDSFNSLTVKRYFVFEGSLEFDTKALSFSFPNGSLEFELKRAEGEMSSYVNKLMAELEAKVAEEAYRKCRPDLVITDGTVHYSTRLKKLPFVGYVKKQKRLYIPSDRSSIIRALRVGQRTPIVRLHSQPTMEGEGVKNFDKFTWYVKISDAEGISGIARLEMWAEFVLDKVKTIADITAYIIPRFASAEFSDRRAPHNLTPVKHLENVLRRRLGNQTLIRRIISSELTGN